MTRTYRKIADSRRDIIVTAWNMARVSHYRDLRRDEIAASLNISASNITRVIGDMDVLRTLVIGYAIDANDHKVVAQAIIDGHPAISHLNQKQRRKALKSFC